MNTKQTILFGLLALLGGIIGGILSDGLPGKAVAESDVEKVVRAEKFELVDGGGNEKAYLTTHGSSAVLHLGEGLNGPYYRITRSDSGIEMIMQSGFSVESTIIFLSSFDDEAQIELRAKSSDSGKKALKMRLGIDSKGEPMLRLYDDIYKPRLEIGKTELKNTKTGSTEIRSTGSIVIYDEKGKVIYSVP